MRLNQFDAQEEVTSRTILLLLLGAFLLPFFHSSASAGAAFTYRPLHQAGSRNAGQPDQAQPIPSNTGAQRIPIMPIESDQQEDFYQQTVLPGLCRTYDFESGNPGFTTQTSFPAMGASLWHIDDNTCRANLSGHSTTHTFYYGQDATCNYATGARNASDLISPTSSFTSPSRAMISFNYLLFVEGGGFDTTFVDASTDGGSNWTQILSKANFINDNQWHTVCKDLTGTFGFVTSVRLRFRFDSVDNIANSTTGWHVDDISICATPSIQDNTNGNCLAINLCDNTYTWHTPGSGDFTGPLVITQSGNTIQFTSDVADPNRLSGGFDGRRTANARIFVPGVGAFTIADSNIDNNTTCP